MPLKPSRNRNYKQEYERYHARPEQKKRRAGRNRARRLMAKMKGRAALKNKDVDHRDRNPINNATNNLRVQSRSLNRSRNS